MRQEWSDAELSASVDAYREMARLEASGVSYSKKQVYRDLAGRFGRADKAFEYRMQNISAVLDEMGMPWIQGLKPATNVGARVKPRLVRLLKNEPLESLVKRRKLPASYKEKLPAIRDWLIVVARSRGVVTYSDVMMVFNIDRFSLRHAMDQLGHGARDRGEPILTALIVGKNSRVCSAGLANEFGIENDGLERTQLYEYWSAQPEAKLAKIDDKDGPSLAVKAARFASVAVRPDQAAFRRRVFEACRGRCIVSGCDVEKALEAAHRKGRSWKLGHNRAEDGFLLRRDLHALYDYGKLRISEQGLVELDEDIRDYYREFDHLRIPIS